MRILGLALIAGLGPAATLAGQQAPADVIYRNGFIYTVDQKETVAEAVAVRDGLILYVGTGEGATTFAGKDTRVIDLGGRVMMPGLVDGHIHPISGGQAVLACNMNYEPLTVEQLLARLQACLDGDKGAGEKDWLVVRAWFRQAMLPKGTDMTAALLDRLNTRRPIKLRSSDGHTIVTNGIGLRLAGVTKDTAAPKDGVIGRDAAGNLTGAFEDGAQDLIDRVIPEPAGPEKEALLRKRLGIALKTMAAQGITSFFDASVDEDEMKVYGAFWAEGKLPLRAHLAYVTSPEAAKAPEKAVAKLKALEAEWTRPDSATRPGLTLHYTKLFLDGVIQGPAFTAALVEPYLVNRGTTENPHFVPGESRGEYYFPQGDLNALLVALGKAGIDPHLHTDGDGAVNEGLNAVAAMRAAVGDKDIRPAFAHNETVIPSDYARFRDLGVTPVISMQWGKPAPDTLDTVRDYIGPDRFNYLETAGKFRVAGVRVAYGSDWPVDALDEWFGLKVGVTRANTAAAGPDYAGRLGDDPGLTPAEALRSITANSAWQLHKEKVTGSIEPGKYADLIVLDRNPLKIAPAEIAEVKVLMTIVGGKTVYRADGF